ncbi:ECF transporter S component [Clostridium sediminicola]|uniref:ECF transporter S component n=1 Tax=Clostridium sediminicola TaxID=3114879 RepID=UPI0031F25A5E
MKKNFNVFRLVIIGLMAAICFVCTWIHIPISIGGFNSMIHLGTTAIFILAIIVGKDAGIAAAIGMSLFDIMDPAFAYWAPFTFIIKGLTGYFVGLIAFSNDSNGNNLLKNVIAFIAGGLISLVGYFLAGIFIYQSVAVSFAHTSTSVISTSIGIIITIPISKIIKNLVPRSINAKIQEGFNMKRGFYENH